MDQLAHVDDVAVGHAGVAHQHPEDRRRQTHLHHLGFGRQATLVTGQTSAGGLPAAGQLGLHRVPIRYVHVGLSIGQLDDVGSVALGIVDDGDRKSTRLNSSHG